MVLGKGEPGALCSTSLRAKLETQRRALCDSVGHEITTSVAPEGNLTIKYVKKLGFMKEGGW